MFMAAARDEQVPGHQDRRGLEQIFREHAGRRGPGVTDDKGQVVASGMFRVVLDMAPDALSRLRGTPTVERVPEGVVLRIPK